MACGVNGSRSRLYVEPGASPHGFDTSSERWPFRSETLKSTGSINYSDQILGTRSQNASFGRRGPYTIAGSIEFHATPRNLLAWLTRALGSETTGTVSVADEVPEFGVLLDRLASQSQYQNCKVNTLTLRGTAGGLVEMSVGILGRGWASGTTAPAVDVTYDEIDQPLQVSDLTATLGGTVRALNSFELTIDNLIEARLRNALYPDCLREGDRLVTLRANVPYNTANHSAFDEPSLDGVVGSLAFTNGTVGATISLPALQKPRDEATIPGKSEVPFDLNFVARATDSANEIEATIDTAA